MTEKNQKQLGSTLWRTADDLRGVMVCLRLHASHHSLLTIHFSPFTIHSSVGASSLNAQVESGGRSTRIECSRPCHQTASA